jgi:hypothetical protein
MERVSAPTAAVTFSSTASLDAITVRRSMGTGCNDTPVRSLCSRMVCTRREMIGEDVQPDWSPHVCS